MDFIGEPITWRCSASGHGRFYLAEVLDRRLPSFQLTVYQGELLDLTQPRSTLTIQIEENSDLGLIGHSLNQGEPMAVYAFRQSLEFEVNHAALGLAIGRCERNVEWE